MEQVRVWTPFGWHRVPDYDDCELVAAGFPWIFWGESYYEIVRALMLAGF